VAYAFDGTGTPSNVTIRGLVIENYANSAGEGAIRGAHRSQWITEGWVIEDCEIRYTAGGAGLKTGHRMVVRNNYLHHNDQYGISGEGTDVLVVGNEIAYNNYRNAEPVNGAGTKFVLTNGLIVRDNHVHHNHGPGLWTDIGNVNALIEGNTVEDNYQQGIFHEISHSAVIRNNVVRRNGLVHQSDWLYDAGILIAHSDNVEVYGNTVENNWNGIVGIQQDRDDHQLRNLWVHDNTITMSRGGSGVGQGGSPAYDPFHANNRFDRNEYRVDGNLDKPFRWEGSQSWSGWRSAGQDVNGSLDQMG
jgi:parallel beta-helix repeat protein